MAGSLQGLQAACPEAAGILDDVISAPQQWEAPAADLPLAWQERLSAFQRLLLHKVRLLLCCCVADPGEKLLNLGELPDAERRSSCSAAGNRLPNCCQERAGNIRYSHKLAPAVLWPQP